MGDFKAFVQAMRRGDTNDTRNNLRRCFLERTVHELFKWRPIHYACVNGRTDIVRLLLDNNCEIDCEDRDKWRPIHIACRFGDIDIVKLLIDNGCNIDCENINKWRPIHFACRYQHSDIVRLLVENNCSIDCENGNYENPLDLADRNNQPASFELIKHIKDISVSIRSNNIDQFQRLYNGRSGIIIASDFAVSLLGIAVKNKCDRIVKYLMDKRMTDEELTYMTNVITKMGTLSGSLVMRECLLYRCIRDHHAEGFRQFCVADIVNGDHRLIPSSSSFIEIVAQFGCTAFVDELLKKSIYHKQKWAQARLVAARGGFVEIADNIESRALMIESRLTRRFSLLHTAVCDNDSDVVAYILRMGIYNVDNNRDVFKSALNLARSFCYVRCISVLEQFNDNQSFRNRFS